MSDLVHAGRTLARVTRSTPFDGPMNCPECIRRKRKPACNVIHMPGVCEVCMREDRAEEATQRLAAAVHSIHPERAWARSLDMPLLAERCPVTWRVWLDGAEHAKASGNGLSAMTDDVRGLLQGPRLVITGPQTGAGKTSIAVALMRMMLDAARDVYINGGSESALAMSARALFVAAIDLNDPEVCKRAETTPFLVLDDAGKEAKAGGFEAERRCAVTADLLDRRERTRAKRTIVTTYGGQEDWVRWYSGRIERFYWLSPGSTVLEVKLS